MGQVPPTPPSTLGAESQVWWTAGGGGCLAQSPAFGCQERPWDPHPSLPRGAPTNSLARSPSSPPRVAKVHLGRNTGGEGGEGALRLPHTHRHSPLALAGPPRWLGSSPPSILLRALRPHTRSQAAAHSHPRPLLCRAAGREDLASTSPDTTQNLVVATSELLPQSQG